MVYFLIFFIFLFGLCIGSFLNVVIYRLETGEGIVKKRSHCPGCQKTLAWYELIPLASFLILRGRCRHCRESISWQYPLVELSAGLLFVLIFNFQFSIFNEFSIFKISISGWLGLIWLLYVAAVLIIIFVYDLKHYLIPDKILWPALGITFLYRLVEALNLGGWGFLNPLLSALAAAGFFLAIVVLTRGRGMGLGDVKLAFLMGLMLGWPMIGLALMLAFFSGSVVGIFLVIKGAKKMDSQIPFGPFLIGGTVLALLWGGGILNWVWRLLL